MGKDLGLGLGLLAGGIFMLIESASISTAGIRTVVGPGAFPSIIGGGLVVVGACIVVSLFFRPGVRKAASDAASRAEPIHLAPVLLIVGASIAQTLLLQRLGWILASSLLFVLTAYAFGARNILKAFGIGLAMTCVVFVLFNYGLDLNLPSGQAFDFLMSRT